MPLRPFTGTNTILAAARFGNPEQSIWLRTRDLVHSDSSQKMVHRLNPFPFREGLIGAVRELTGCSARRLTTLYARRARRPWTPPGSASHHLRKRDHETQDANPLRAWALRCTEGEQSVLSAVVDYLASRHCGALEARERTAVPFAARSVTHVPERGPLAQHLRSDRPARDGVSMAIYHLSVRPISRAQGRSATSAAAYRSCSLIRDERTADVHDYSWKRGLEHAEIVLPAAAAKRDINWARNRTAQEFVFVHD